MKLLLCMFLGFTLLIVGIVAQPKCHAHPPVYVGGILVAGCK
jgi:hypothetical protein